jgi:YVTN family beta-propeller protein
MFPKITFRRTVSVMCLVVSMGLGLQTILMVHAANCSSIPVGNFDVSSTLVGSNLYTNNENSDTVSVVNTTTNSVSTTINVGDRPVASGLVGSKLYVMNTGSQNVSVINTITNTVTSTIPVGGFYQVAGQSDLPVYNGRIYIGTNAGVKVIDSNTDTVIATLSSSGTTTNVNVTPSFIYVSSYSNYSAPGAVWKYNTSTNAFVAAMSVGNGPGTTTLVGNKLFVNNTNSPTMTVLDNTTNSVIGSVNIFRAGYFNTITIGSKLYVTGGNGNQIYVVDTNTYSVSSINTSGSSFKEMLLVGSKIFAISFDWPRPIQVVDTTNDTFVASINDGSASSYNLKLVAGKLYVLRAYSNDVRVINPTTNSYEVLCSIGSQSSTPTGTLGGLFPTISFSGNTIDNGIAGTLTLNNSGDLINGTFQSGNFVPGNGSIIPYTADIGSSTAVLAVSGAQSVTINTNFSLPNPSDSPDLPYIFDTGRSSFDNITYYNQPPISVPCFGTLDVDLIENNSIIGTGSCTGSSSTDITPASSFSDGEHSIAYRFKRGSSISSNSPSLTITTDTVAPNPLETSLLSPQYDQTPEFSLSCEANAFVSFTISPTGESLTDQLCPSTQSLGFTAGVIIPQGSYQLVASQTDVAGLSFSSSYYNGNVDTDSDNDLVPDEQELLDNTSVSDPRDYKDSDKDLVPDYIELLDSTDVNDSTSFLDDDNGGTPNYVEDVILNSIEGVLVDSNNAADDNADYDSDLVDNYTELKNNLNVINNDSDNDGTIDGKEFNSQVIRDINGDSIIDALQQNISNVIPQQQSVPVYLEVTGGCDQIREFREITMQQLDEGYIYPKGIYDFRLTCANPGENTTVKLTFFDTTMQSGMIVRKYTSSFSTIPNALVSSQTISGKPSIVVTYQLTDGGSLDSDGTVNGEIRDPVGLAVLQNIAPTNTNSLIRLIRTGGKE